MSAPAEPSRLADLEHPWVGLESFREETRDFFFGRETEIAELLLRMRSQPLLVLYGRSGFGKTSVLSAGVLPRLRREGYRATIHRLRYGQEDPTLLDQLLFHLGVRDAIRALPFPLPDDTTSRLWLHIHRKLPWSGVTHLILDQFEEIFTIETQRPGTEEEVREALGILIQGAVPESVTRCLETEEAFFDYFDPDSQPVRVILALRDDYVYALNRWRRYLSQLGQNYFELRALSGPAAFDAVFRPGCLRAHMREQSDTLIDADTGLPPIVTEATARRIVRFVAEKKDDVPLEQIEVVPPILSLLCRELNERRYQQPPGAFGTPAAEIVFDEQETNVETILETFYERCLRGRPEAVRICIEEDLVSRSGIRLQNDEHSIIDVFVNGCEIPGDEMGRHAVGYDDRSAATACLRELVNQRLLSSTAGGNYELTHDLLCRIVYKSRTARQERLEKEHLQHQAKEEVKAKEDAESRAEQEKRAKEEAEKTAIKLRRLAFVTAGAAVAALVLLVISIFLWRNSVSARRAAEEQARHARAAADTAQHALTDSFFRTIGVSNQGVPPRDEREALWELAQLNRANAAVRDNLLKRWFGTEEAFMRGEARNGQGFRAATGLTLEYHRLAISGAAELGRRLAAALENPQETNSIRVSSLGSALAALAAKMEPHAATDIAKGLATALENPQETDSDRVSSLGNALAALAAKMEPQAAAEVARRGAQRLAGALENPQETNSTRLSSLGSALAELTTKMESQAAAKIAEQGAQRLARALENPQETNSTRLSSLGDALAELAAKMEPRTAAEIAKGLAGALENPQETDSIRLSSLGGALAALAAKMEPQAAAEIVKSLATALENPQETDSGRLSSLGSALAALAAKMEPQAVAEIAKGLAIALENPQKADSDRLSSLGSALAALAAKMDPRATAEIARRGAQRLAGALENPQETNSMRASSLGDALAALAAKMEPQAVAEIAKGLVTSLENPQETDSYRLSSLGNALAKLVAKMEAQAAAEIARRGAQRLAAALENPQETDSYRLSSLGGALAELAAKMESQAAAEIARRGAQRLATALENPQETDSYRLSSLGGALAELAAKMEPQAATKIARRGAQRLAAALENPQETDSYRLSSLGSALAELAAKMEPQAAAEIARQGAQRLARALENPQETNSTRLSSLGSALAELAAKMDPRTAAEIAKGLAAALENPQETDSYRLSSLGKTLATFCALLPSADHMHLLALSNMLLMPVSKKEDEGEEQPYDRKLLTAVCAQLRPQDLVDVLKYPFCAGEAGQIVFKQLEAKTGGDFVGNVWKLVEQADALGIKDVDSPAQRPSAQDALKELNKL